MGINFTIILIIIKGLEIRALFSGTVYSREFKLLQVNYESFDCELTEIFFIHCAKDDWDFRISDLVKNPDGTDI